MEKGTLGIALSGHTVAATLLSFLEAKGIISEPDRKELLDRILLNLEEHQGLAAPGLQDEFRIARTLIEQMFSA